RRGTAGERRHTADLRARPAVARAARGGAFTSQRLAPAARPRAPSGPDTAAGRRQYMVRDAGAAEPRRPRASSLPGARFRRGQDAHLPVLPVALNSRGFSGPHEPTSDAVLPLPQLEEGR